MILILVILLPGCSLGDVPLSIYPPTEETIVVEEVENISTVTPEEFQNYSINREYSVVWVRKEDGLHVRKPAGISGSIVEDLPWNARQIYLTDNRSLLGSSLWVEILLNGDLTGWVNAWNLTEFVSKADFCQDQRVVDLLNRFQTFIQDPRDPMIQNLISPNHGLSIRHNWYNLDVNFTGETILNDLSDVAEINWGIMADSGLETLGSYEQIIQPKLDDVFLDSPEIFCNELKWGNTSGEVQWPDEFTNLNFYSFYRPALEGGNEFDWRTWAIGIEYVDNQPFIAALIHYSSEL